MTAAKKPAATKKPTRVSAPAAARKTVEPPPDTFEAIQRDYIALALRYKRREIDRHQTLRERQALEVRMAALKGDAA